MITVPAPRGAQEQSWAGSLTWCSAGSTVHVAVAEPHLLRRAVRLTARRLAAVERACLLPDGELSRVNRAGGRTLRISPVLADVVTAALVVAERTGGDVDPVRSRTVPGPAERLSAIPTCAAFPPPLRRADRHDVHLTGCRLTLPAGVCLDLRSVAAAVAADRCAAAASSALDCGVLVGVAGATATAGPSPEGGWEQPGLMLPAGTAASTSYPHELDPDLAGVEPVWSSATVLAFGAVEARAYSLAALTRGTGAPRWLTELGVTGRLVTQDGRVVPVGGWDRTVTS